MNMKKITKIIAVSAIIILPALTFAAVGAPTTDDAGNAGTSGGSSSNTPSVTDGGNAGSTGNGGSFTPSVDDQGNAATKSSVSSKKTSGTSGSGSRNTSRVCPLITDYLAFGEQNNAAEVMKLQLFLNLYENAKLDVNGNFDEKTVDAVKAFQTKYFTDTMSPWGADQASGKVFITTLKKINEIYCGNPRALTAEELAIIASFKSSLALGSSNTIVSEGNVVENNINPSNSNENTDNGQTASASGSKAGQFFRGIVKFLINR
jgi:peptidoglycan hydrolase-like protein with peptidoglycan-binding domain